MTVLYFLALWLLLLGAPESARAGLQAGDSLAVFRRAQRAHMAYEYGIRGFAPISGATVDRSGCDEVVGRYCIIYDSGPDRVPPEPVRLKTARDSAIAALQRAFRLSPARPALATALVRDLTRDGRSANAVQVARAFAARVPGPDAAMLLAYALNADRQTNAALAEFHRWLKLLPERQRARAMSIDWLLKPEEQRRRKELSEAARQQYDSTAWRWADPLYLTPGNELLAEHYARRVLAILLERGPVPANGDVWGDDSDQLLVRYGEPFRTTRSATTTSLTTTQSYTDHWDPSGHTYFPPSLEATLAMPARVDTIWPIDSATTRSGHAPPTIRYMRVLEHQAAVFPRPDATLLVNGMVRVDSAAHREALVGALFLLDSALNVIGRTDARLEVRGDTIAFSASMEDGRDKRDQVRSFHYYSAEVYDTVSRFAARARYRVVPMTTDEAITLSGLVLTAPFAGDSAPPLLRPVVVTGSQFGIYAEALNRTDQPQTLRVELDVRATERASAPARLAGWLKGRLGLKPAGSRPTLGWNVELAPNAHTPVTLTVDAGPLKPGRYLVRLSAERAGSEKALVAEREFLVTED